MFRPGAGYRAAYRLLDAIRRELECRDAPACQYDVIASQSDTQRGADLRGPGTQGRVWVRIVEESSPTLDYQCPPWLQVELEAAVLRCHQAVAGDDQSLPGEEVYAAEMLRVEIDRQAVAAAAATVRRPRLTLTGWRPYGPQSVAIGGITTFRLRRAT